jgi:hypothetical protein
MDSRKRKITPKEALNILEKQGTIITIDEAEKVVDFLYKFGQLALKIVLKKSQPLN